MVGWTYYYFVSLMKNSPPFESAFLAFEKNSRVGLTSVDCRISLSQATLILSIWSLSSLGKLYISFFAPGV